MNLGAMYHLIGDLNKAEEYYLKCKYVFELSGGSVSAHNEWEAETKALQEIHLLLPTETLLNANEPRIIQKRKRKQYDLYFQKMSEQFALCRETVCGVYEVDMWEFVFYKGYVR